MKYKILALFTFFCISHYNIFADDVTINVQNIFVNGSIVTPGSINFTFDATVLDVQLSGTSFCGDISAIIISSTTYSIPVSCPGEYCFSITSEPGTPNECCMYLCVTVDLCKIVVTDGPGPGIPYVTIICKAVALGLQGNDDNIFLETSLEDMVLSDSGNEGSASATVHTSLEANEYSKIETLVEEVFISVLEEIKVTGKNANIVESQDEFESDAPILMKFNAKGELEWVYYNENELRNREIQERSRTDLIEAQIQIGEIFPNPFKSELNVNVTSALNKSIEVSLVNTLGKLVLLQDFDLIQGENNLYLNLDNVSLSEGMFILMVRDKNGFQFSQKLVRIK